jgi:hypothetical protein
VPTRLAYRQAAARAVGTLHTGVATGGSTQSLLEATAWPFKSTISQNERFEHWYLHRPTATTADRSRAVASGGYIALAGTLAPDRLYDVAPAVGEPFELMNMLDPDTLHRLIGDVLALCPVTSEVTFTTSATTTVHHSLASAAPWLTDPDWVYQVGYLAPADVRSDVDPFSRPRRGRAIERGGVVYLEGPAFNPTDTVYVLASRPAASACRSSGGTYGDQTGLALDTDEAPVEVDWVAAGVKMFAWDEFRELFWPGEARTAETKVAQAAARFWALARTYWHEPRRSFTPLRAWGPPMLYRTPV